jgi:hypothetical protein
VVSQSADIGKWEWGVGSGECGVGANAFAGEWRKNNVLGRGRTAVCPYSRFLPKLGCRFIADPLFDKFTILSLIGLSPKSLNKVTPVSRSPHVFLAILRFIGHEIFLAERSSDVLMIGSPAILLRQISGQADRYITGRSALVLGVEGVAG